MKYIASAVISLVAFLGFAYVLIDTSDNTSFGAAGDSYSYRHYTSANASNTAGVLVKGGAGELGPVVINTTSAVALTLYDSSATATSSATKIGILKASIAEQSLEYNVAFTKGLMIEIPGAYDGDITIGVR